MRGATGGDDFRRPFDACPVLVIMKTDDQVRSEVRDHYSSVARGGTSCCGGTDARTLGYAAEDLAAPGNLGLGCGNPQAIAALRPGEVVLDLGSGGGFDCFLAARAVGGTGRVIGIDMSADMIALARGNAASHGAGNVEFRLGEIEHLPVADGTIDVAISNCVINLAPDKRAVYAELFRVLAPGGRLAISDVVALRPLPAELADDVAAHCGCVAGAALAPMLASLLGELGFVDVRVDPDPASRDVIAGWAPGRGFEELVASARITARKPGGACCAPGCCG
jgi:arsenite methyltransferase